MTKTQLIELIAARASHVPHREIESMVNAVFDLMGNALRRGERIEIRGFGCFAVRTREARAGRNPKTGEKVLVPRRQTLSFTVGKELKERIAEAGAKQLTPAVEETPVEPLLEAVPELLAASGAGTRTSRV